MTWGERVEFLEELERTTGQMPEALITRPVLSETRQSYFMSVFYELTESRDYSAGGTPLPITLGEMRDYCEMFYITTITERETLMKMVRAIDRAYIKQAVETAKAAAKN